MNPTLQPHGTAILAVRRDGRAAIAGESGEERDLRRKLEPLIRDRDLSRFIL